MAMLGEIVVHGEDIRRPLGLSHRPPDAALIALADSWKKSNLLIGAKRRIAGLRLQATDLDWDYGSGPELSGPMDSSDPRHGGSKGCLCGPQRGRCAHPRRPALSTIAGRGVSGPDRGRRALGPSGPGP